MVKRLVDISQHTIYVFAALAAIFGVISYVTEADDRVLERKARIALLTNNAWQTLASGSSTRAQTEAFRTLLELGIDLDGAEIDELQLIGLDLTGMTIEDFKANDVRFSEMRADGMTFANWARKDPSDQPKVWRIVGSSLKGATFDDSIMVFTRFESSDLGGASFKGTDLIAARFERVDLRGADLSGTSLAGVTFNGVDLRGADLTGAKDRVPFILAERPSFTDVCVDDTTKLPDWYQGPRDCPAERFTESAAWAEQFASLRTQKVRRYDSTRPWWEHILESIAG